MSSVKIIHNQSEINLNNKWVPSTKFNSKDRIVDQNGHKIGSGYKGRQYRIIEKRERAFSGLERFGRGLLGTVAVICTLCFALFSKSVRNLFTKSKENIRFAVLETPVNLSSKKDLSLGHQITPPNTLHKEDETTFPLDVVKNDCQHWMNTFLKDFEPLKVKKYKIEQLYIDDVLSSKEETKAMRAVYKTLWNERGTCWMGGLPDGWTKHSGSIRSWNVEHIKYPDHIFKFCSRPPGRGVPAAHFLRVPKGKEIQRIVDEEGLDELEVVDERLIALKSQDEIQEEDENEQCYHFVVKSKKINLLNNQETISRLSSLPQQKQIKIATQIMQMICKSGLGDVGFHNFNINKETGKLVVLDTEPLFGSLLLDEESKFKGQYERTNQLVKISTNSETVKRGLDNMIEACKQLPVFEKVAKVYKECFPVYS